jgi:PilZ domain-containing protein
MLPSSASDAHPKQRRSPRFPFDSLVLVTAFRLGEEAQVWGRSTDLCREGIGVTVTTGELAPEELVTMQIPLPSTKPMNVRALVRCCNQGRCGFEFVDLRNQQHEVIEAACEKLSKTSGDR